MLKIRNYEILSSKLDLYITITLLGSAIIMEERAKRSLEPEIEGILRE